MKKQSARSAVATVIVAVATAILATNVAVAGVTPASLQARGWFCLPPEATPENVYHCFTPGQNSAALNVLVFDADGAYLGTEHLIRADLYAGQPCRGTPEGPYQFVPVGPGYYACHHFDV